MADVPQPGDPGDPNEPAPGGPGPFGLPGFPGIPGLDFSQLDIASLMRMLQAEGPVNWDIARQVASAVATGGETSIEPPVDPSDAAELHDLARAAEGLVAEETGLSAALGVPTRALGRTEWAELHLEALRPVLEAMATTMRAALEMIETAEENDTSDDPSAATASPSGMFGLPRGANPFAGMLTMLAPVLFGVQAGSMVGYLAHHALGRYDLPLPAADAPSLCFVVPNLQAFEDDWSLPHRELRFYVALHEVVRAAQRSVPWVQARLVKMAIEYVSAYQLDVRALDEQFGDIDPSDPASIAGIAEHPDALLSALQSDRQRDMLAEIQEFTMVLEGHADLVVERVGERMIPEIARIHEAARRHHVEQGEASRFLEGLLGVRLEREHYERGEAFCRGVIERAGPSGMARLYESERMVPTPAELGAPGLWLARIDLPDHEGA